MSGKFKNMVIVTAKALKTLNKITILLLPPVIKRPPTSAPQTIPKIAAELISVL